MSGKLTWKPYKRRVQKESQLLLVSRGHLTMNYRAIASESTEGRNGRVQYIGLYDPSTEQWEITRIRRQRVHGTTKADEADAKRHREEHVKKWAEIIKPDKPLTAEEERALVSLKSNNWLP